MDKSGFPWWAANELVTNPATSRIGKRALRNFIIRLIFGLLLDFRCKSRRTDETLMKDGGLVYDKARGSTKSETSVGKPAFTPILEAPAANENQLQKEINNMKKLIFLVTSIAIASSAICQNERPNRERPDFFALADKNQDGVVSFKELVDARIAMMQLLLRPTTRGRARSGTNKETHRNRFKRRFQKG